MERCKKARVDCRIVNTFCSNALHYRTFPCAELTYPCLQIFFQVKYFIPDPIKNDVKYQASAQPFLVFGLLTTGLAIGHVNAMASSL